MADSSGAWVYAIAQHADRVRLRNVTGVGGGPLGTIEGAGLTAVTETVRLDEFGEAALRRNLEDLDWLDGVARAHHRVIDVVAQQGPVVPMRLATVYRTEASLAGLLEERGSDFREALRRIGTCKEWGVKVYAAEPGPGGTRREARASTDTAAAGSGSAADEAGAGAGAAYLRRRRDQMSASKDSRRSAMASTQTVHDKLSRLAAQARLHPPQAPQLTGSKAPMLLNAAYLLDDAGRDAFAAAVAALAQEHPSIRLELTGPWPPYSFAGADEQNTEHQGG